MRTTTLALVALGTLAASAAPTEWERAEARARDIPCGRNTTGHPLGYFGFAAVAGSGETLQGAAQSRACQKHHVAFHKFTTLHMPLPHPRGIWYNASCRHT